MPSISQFVSTKPVVTAGVPAYASGDSIGGKLTFAGATQRTVGGLLQSVVIVDDAGQSANVDLLLFSADPTSTTFTDNAAVAINEADMENLIAAVSITTHVVVASGKNVSVASGLQIPLVGNSLRQVFGALVSRATPTFVATDDVTVKLGLEVFV